MKIRATAAALATLMLLASCGDSEAGGEPTADPIATASGEPTADVDSENGDSDAEVTAPTVSNPVTSLAQYKKKPCSMLTPQQAESIGFPRPENATEDKSQPGCRWRGTRDSRVTINIQSGEKWSLRKYYEIHAKDSDAFAYFEPVTIGGFPAVFATDFDQREDGGSCAMTVALTDQDVLRMSNGLFIGAEQRDKPCAQLEETAEAAVKTMSAGT